MFSPWAFLLCIKFHTFYVEKILHFQLSKIVFSCITLNYKFKKHKVKTMKTYLITFAIVVVAVIAANYLSSKLGLDTYEVYQ